MATRIMCNVESCVYRSDEGICTHTSIHLQACSCDADNVVACSEFLEMIMENPCPNCEETKKNCACMRNKCIRCGKPVGNITFSSCDLCWADYWAIVESDF